jgi:glycosyltransferase involved in cell wall biosynthesis
VKVLLVADAVGGVFTHAVELARALAAARVKVVLATEGAELTPDRRRQVASLHGVVHEGRAYRLEWMPEPWDDVAASGRWLLALEARERPDVVHTCELAHGALPFRAPKVVAGHSCVDSWFESVRGAPPGAEWGRYHATVRAGLRGASAIVAPSAWMARALVRHHAPILAPKVVPNGRDGARFWSGPKEDLVLAAGRIWDEAKNVAALVRVAPRLPWPVLVAGDSAPPTSAATSTVTTASSPAASTAAATSTAPAAATLLGAHRHAATFLGRLPEEELAQWLSRAAIFAHPARYEPFGLAVLEAALSGCALVLGDLESLRERWDGAAEFVAPWDEDALAAAIVGLARDRERREALAAAGRERALTLTPRRMAEGYRAVYRALVRGAQGGAA